MAEFTPVVDLGTIDLTAEELDVGDTSAHVAKMSALMTKIESWTDQFAATALSMNTRGQELVDAQFSDIAQIGALSVLVSSLKSDIANLETVSGVDLADLEAKAEAIDTIIANAGTLTPADITGLEDIIHGLPGKATPLNALKGHGMFLSAAPDEDYIDNDTATFDISEFSTYMTGSNGTDFDTAVNAGRFWYNNTTNGGTAPGFTTPVSQFATAMGINTSRYSANWVIAEITTGASVGSTEHDGHYLHYSTSKITKLLGDKGNISMAFWFQSKNDDFFVRGNSVTSTRQAYIDGVRLDSTGGEASDAAVHRIVAGQVVHLAFSYKATDIMQQSSGAWLIYTKPSSIIRYACPVVHPGAFQIKPSAGIVRSAL